MELNFNIKLTKTEREAIKLVGDLINEMYDNCENVCNVLDTYCGDFEELKDRYEDFSEAIDNYFGD